MRLTNLCLLLLFAVGTDLAYRWFWYSGLATPDPPFLLVLWLSLSDHRLRLHVAILILSLVRTVCGPEPLFQIWLPLATAAEVVRFLGTWLNVRDPLVRSVPIAFGVALSITIDGWLHDYGPLSTLTPQVIWGSLYGTLSAFILFPILDALKPTLRSYAYGCY